MVVDAVTAKMMELGVFCMGWVSHLVIAPPLIIDDAGIDEAIGALDQALSIADAKI
jgi:taurine---2-oxoglutarate transaminase